MLSLHALLHLPLLLLLLLLLVVLQLWSQYPAHETTIEAATTLNLVPCAQIPLHRLRRARLVHGSVWPEHWIVLERLVQKLRR